MIYIDGYFEPCSTEEDIIKICREYINDEFANAVESQFDILRDEISDLESDLEMTEDMLTDKEYELEDL